VNEAKMSLSKLAGDVSSWWAALDPMRGAEASVSTSEPSTSKANVDVRRPCLKKPFCLALNVNDRLVLIVRALSYM
jgi:hypothetical protein